MYALNRDRRMLLQKVAVLLRGQSPTEPAHYRTWGVRRRWIWRRWSGGCGGGAGGVGGGGLGASLLSEFFQAWRTGDAADDQKHS